MNLSSLDLKAVLSSLLTFSYFMGPTEPKKTRLVTTQILHYVVLKGQKGIISFQRCAILLSKGVVSLYRLIW